MIDRDRALERLQWCHQNNWLASCEVERLAATLRSDFIFGESLQVAETPNKLRRVQSPYI